MELRILTKNGAYGIGYNVLVATTIEAPGFKYGKTRRSVSNTFPTKDLAKDFEKVVCEKLGCSPMKSAVDKINSSMTPDEVHSIFKSIPCPTYDKKEFEPQIVVFKEKHGDLHYIIHSADDFRKICLSLVKERNEYGWYSHLEYQKEPVVPTFTKESISTLPTEFQAEATKTWSRYEKDMKTYKEFQSLIELRKKALDGDGYSAAEFIQEMNSGEYGGYEIIQPCEY
jgi:hypothetical protein